MKRSLSEKTESLDFSLKATSVLNKEGYPSVLHLNDEMLVIVGYTIDIKDAATEIIRFSKLFLILECYVLDLKFAFKQVVQKINQQVLAELLTEETLEAPVGKGVDVSTHKNRFILYNSVAKIHFFIETS